MESRKAKIIISRPGGNASKGSHTYKVSLPTNWMKQFDVSESKRECELLLDFEHGQIILKFKKET